MTHRDDSVTLQQMLVHAREALTYLNGKSRADLEHDRVLTLALLHLLLIIGEAAGRVSAACQSAQPQIPWPQIVALRNRLIHGYDVIDLDIVWSILSSDLPKLVDELERLTPP